MTIDQETTKTSDAEFGSDVLVDMLVELGIEFVAFAPGATFRGLHDSLVNYTGEKPEIIECLHEEISVAIAHGYAKATGTMMAVAVHNVVGLQHATMAIYNAWCDRVPVLLIGGTGPVDAAKRRPWVDGIHTATVQATQIRDYTKWDDQPASLEALAESIVRAHRVAVASPQGPVYVCVDSTIQEQSVPPEFARRSAAEYAMPSPLAPDPAAINEIAEKLMAARFPLIVAEYADRDQQAMQRLVDIAEMLAIPVAEFEREYNRASFCFPTQHPLNLSGIALPEIPDVVLSLEAGELRELFEPDRPVWVAEVSTAPLRARAWIGDLQRIQPAALSIAADVGPALEALWHTLRAKMPTDPTVAERRAQRYRVVTDCVESQRAQWRGHARLDSGPSISRAQLASVLDEVTRDQRRVLANGNLHNWVHRLWKIDEADSYLGGSGGAGLGYGLGASIGAALAHRDDDRLVIDIQSDGDALMTPSALWTAAHYRAPLLIVMDNNRRYENSVNHAIRVADTRNRSRSRSLAGTGVTDPDVDFAGLARSFGIHGIGPVTDPAELRDVLKTAVDTVINERRPVLVDVITTPDRA